MPSQGSRNEANRRQGGQGWRPSTRRYVIGRGTFDMAWMAVLPYRAIPREALWTAAFQHEVLLRDKGGELIWHPPFPIAQRFASQGVNASHAINSVPPGCMHVMINSILGFSCCSSWSSKKEGPRALGVGAGTRTWGGKYESWLGSDGAWAVQPLDAWPFNRS